MHLYWFAAECVSIKRQMINIPITVTVTIGWALTH